MANAIYPKFKERILQTYLSGGTGPTGTLKAVLIDTADDTYNAADEFLDDIVAGARVGTPQTIGSLTYGNGVLDGADITFPTVAGDQSEALLIYLDTGVEATSPLVAWIDTATGLPVTPSGGNIPVTWNASGIFAL